MIKNVKKYLKESQKEREEYLQNFSLKKRIHITESLLETVDWFKDNFSKSEVPSALVLCFKKKKNGKKRI